MRSRKDRRKNTKATPSPIEDNGRTALLGERRRNRERRMENMKAEERQLLFSEMPSPTNGKSS